jgi:hypothetical protein
MNTWFSPTPCVTDALGNESWPNPNCVATSEPQMPTSNLEQLIAAAHILRPMLDELVFVGGIVTGLLITDAAASEPRATLDVDALAEISSYAEYVAFGGCLRSLGFAEDTRPNLPVCRWPHRRSRNSDNRRTLLPRLKVRSFQLTC